MRVETLTTHVPTQIITNTDRRRKPRPCVPEKPILMEGLYEITSFRHFDGDLWYAEMQQVGNDATYLRGIIRLKGQRRLRRGMTVGLTLQTFGNSSIYEAQ